MGTGCNLSTISLSCAGLRAPARVCRVVTSRRTAHRARATAASIRSRTRRGRRALPGEPDDSCGRSAQDWSSRHFSAARSAGRRVSARPSAWPASTSPCRRTRRRPDGSSSEEVASGSRAAGERHLGGEPVADQRRTRPAGSRRRTRAVRRRAPAGRGPLDAGMLGVQVDGGVELLGRDAARGAARCQPPPGCPSVARRCAVVGGDTRPACTTARPSAQSPGRRTGHRGAGATRWMTVEAVPRWSPRVERWRSTARCHRPRCHGADWCLATTRPSKDCQPTVAAGAQASGLSGPRPPRCAAGRQARHTNPKSRRSRGRRDEGVCRRGRAAPCRRSAGIAHGRRIALWTFPQRGATQHRLLDPDSVQPVRIKQPLLAEVARRLGARGLRGKVTVTVVPAVAPAWRRATPSRRCSRVRVHSCDPTRTEVAPCCEAFATAYAPAPQAARSEPAVTVRVRPRRWR